jgi:hypothetical protein
MTRDDVKFMIIENYIDHYTTSEAEREAMKDEAFAYVEEDHIDEIGQSFPETAKPQGFQNWIKTYYEVVDWLTCRSCASGSMHMVAKEQGGRTALYHLAENLTDEFEATHDEQYADGWIKDDYPEAIEAFMKAKQEEQYKINHGLI